MHDALTNPLMLHCLAAFTDLLPEWAHIFVGTAAVMVGVVGVIIWATGYKIARVGVALTTGAVAAAVGAWLLPQYLGIAAISGVLVGFAIGALFGAVAFRLLLGFALATTLSLAVTGTYYRWHVVPEMHSNTAIATAGPTTAGISSFLLPTDQFPLSATPEETTSQPASTQPTTADGFAKAVGKATSDAVGELHVNDFARSLITAWGDIPKRHQQRLTILFVAIYAIALLIAFGFPRHTTLVVSAILGSILLYAGTRAILHIYVPQYEALLPWNLRVHYGVLGGLTLAGMLLQYALFWPKRKKQLVAAPVQQIATPVAA